MADPVTITEAYVKIAAVETSSADLGDRQLTHTFEWGPQAWSNSDFDVIYSGRGTAPASPVAIDMGSVNPIINYSAQIVTLHHIIVANNSTTPGEVLEVSAEQTWSGVITDIRKIYPSGFVIYSSPIDDIDAAGVLTLNPGAANIPYTVFLLGKST